MQIDVLGNARLTEYGLGPINRSAQSTVAAAPTAVEGPLAPELTNVTNAPIVESMPGDIFAFSMLAFEVLTGEPPFSGQPPATTALLVSQGGRPEFPQNSEDVRLTAQMQRFLQRCWHHSPTERPTVDDVVRTFELLESNKYVQRTSNE